MTNSDYNNTFQHECIIIIRINKNHCIFSPLIDRPDKKCIKRYRGCSRGNKSKELIELLTDDDLLIEIDFNFLILSFYNDGFLSFKLILILCT